MEDCSRPAFPALLPSAQEAPLGAPRLALGSLRPVLGLLEASRLVPERILTRAGLPADLFARPDDTPVALADYFRLCEQMAVQGDDESCHVSLRPLMAGTSELVQARLRGCRTLADLLDVVAGSYNIIHGRRYNRVVRRGTGIAYEIDDTDFPYALGHDAPFVILSLECLLVYVHVLLLSAVAEGETLVLRRLATRGRAPTAAAALGAAGAQETHLRYWGVPIRHEAPRFALVYGAEAERIAVSPERSPVIAARTIYGGVADMLDRLRPPGRSGAFAERVARLLDEGLTGDRPGDQGAVARRLGISVATLRRALEAEGTRFRDVRAQVLNRAAQAALRDGRSVADVADRLAFSDGRSFARAFRHWNGVSPADYARQARMSENVR